MNSAARFSLSWTPWTLVLALLAVVLTMVFSYLSWRRSGYQRKVLLLEILRIAIVGLAAILLNQPEWVEEFRPQGKPLLAIIADQSDSMRTADLRSAISNEPETRRGALQRLLDADLWDSLRERMDVVVEATAGEGTDLSTPLAAVLERNPSLVGVLVASDGDWNQGVPPADIAGRYRARGIPLLTLPLGSKTQLPDLELISFDVPTFSIVGKTVRIPLTIDSSLPRETILKVTLSTPEGSTLTQDVRVAPMARTSDAILWKPEVVGEVMLTLEVAPHAEESNLENNRRSAPTSIREERLRVLVVESYPRWEYRYLRNALSRDPGVEVSCLLFHPELEKRGGGNADYIQEFPQGKDQLAAFDVVFLGDVGLEQGQLTATDCELLKGLVEQQASGLVFIPGSYGRQFSLLETPLADLYPVTLDPQQRQGWGSPLANHFQLTEGGRRSLLTRLVDVEDENAAVWENLPGFQWYAPVVKARPGTETLAVHAEASNPFGRLPLLVTRTYGSGKVLFMGTDGAWRWRKGVEDVYHYRFWGQVVRWMAYRRNMARGETMRFYYSPEQPLVRQTVSLSANVMDRSGEPLARGEVVARMVSPSGETETIRLNPSGEAWGAFSGRFTPQEAGTYGVTLAAPETLSQLQTSLFVQGAPLEKIGKPARPEVLEEMARLTRGRQLQLDKLEELRQSLATLPDPPPTVRRVQLWSNPWVAAAMVGLLGMFWVGRKMMGFI